MIRQLAQEGESGFHLLVSPDASLWKNAQFEKLCSVACSIADDLFHIGRLESARVAGGELVLTRSMRDLHAFFDQLASLVPSQATGKEEDGIGASNLITFRPLGEGGVAIYVNDLQIGQADD